ncbi:MAG TPA: hypothetical protein VHW09_31605 [Bryobacteraceae bacterium]|jgi:hypothetical protein|nr:hypothetical protein [Bryobacteraceae bacterium]
MHPSIDGLIAFCDGEAGQRRGQAIARHLTKCEKCRARLRAVRSEKAGLGPCEEMPEAEARNGLHALMSSLAEWRTDSIGPSELKVRLRSQIETYIGSAAVPMVERPGMPAEEFLAKTNALLEVFLGPDASEAVMDEALGGLR